MVPGSGKEEEAETKPGTSTKKAPLIGGKKKSSISATATDSFAVVVRTGRL